MVLSKSWSSVIAVSAIASALSVYMTGNFSEFSKSLGVFTVLVLRGMSVHRFLPNFFKQVSNVHFSSLFLFQCIINDYFRYSHL